MSATTHSHLLALVLAGLVSTLAASEAMTVSANGKQPRVAVHGERVAIAYAQGESILVAVSTDTGKTFAAPVSVGDSPRVAVGMRRGPQIAMTAQSIVVAGIKMSSGNLVAWQSRDLGKTWAGPVAVNDKDRSASEGLFSLAAGKDETIWAVWLDLRDRITQVEMARSITGGATWTPNVAFYKAPVGGVCECCQPQVAADANGAVAVMWRNHVGEARDMWASWSKDDGKTFKNPAKLGSGTWNINACPMDGGGISIAEQTVQTVWRREGTMFTSALTDKQESTLGTGKNGTIVIAGGVGGKVYRAWQKNDRILLSIGEQAPTEVGRGGFPQLATSSASEASPVMLVWESGSEVKALRVDL